MINALKGMKDRYSDEIKKYDYIIQKAEETFKKYGFNKIITPILEETELFKRGVGDETDVVSKEMYTFIDKGERNVTLRPEGTASAVRAYLEAGLHKSDPIVKWYYYGPMYRYEAPQKGRMREFHQIGTEVFGIRSPYLDAEIIKMGVDFLKSVGIVETFVEINSLGNIESRTKYIVELKKFIESRIDKLCDNCKNRYEKNPLRALDCKNKSCQEQYKEAPVLYDFLDTESKEYYENVKKYLDILNVKYKENYRLVRGLDYYSDTVFEIKSDKLGAQSTVLAGGRYDRLLNILGDIDMPGIGFAAGVDRIALILDENQIKESDERVYFIYFDETKEYAMKAINSLRENGIRIDFDYKAKSFPTQMKKANRINAKYILIAGTDEMEQNKITIKNFETGKQELLGLQEITKIIVNKNI